VDVVVGHHHARSRLDHDLAHLGDLCTAGFFAVVGTAIEDMPFPSGDRGVGAPDAMVVRRRLLAGKTDAQIETVPIVFFDQQGMGAGVRLRHGEVGQRKQLRALGERHQLQLEGMQRRRRDAFLCRGRMHLRHERLACSRPPGGDIDLDRHGTSLWERTLEERKSSSTSTGQVTSRTVCRRGPTPSSAVMKEASRLQACVSAEDPWYDEQVSTLLIES
jgi:hypothetical protein